MSDTMADRLRYERMTPELLRDSINELDRLTGVIKQERTGVTARIAKMWAIINGERVDLDAAGAVVVEWSDGTSIELAPTTTEELQVYAFMDQPEPTRPNIGTAARFDRSTLYLKPHQGD